MKGYDKPFRIPSDGTIIESPLNMLEQFVDAEYECYDGVRVEQDNFLRPEEIAISVLINSQISGNTARAIWKEALESVEENLQQINPDFDLLDDEENIPWEYIQGAIGAICAVKRAKIAVATKILHKKRPKLVPMVDSVIMGHYRSSFPKRWKGSYEQKAVDVIRLFRKDLLATQDRIQEFKQYFHSRGKPLTLCRILEILIWIETEPSSTYKKG